MPAKLLHDAPHSIQSGRRSGDQEIRRSGDQEIRRSGDQEIIDNYKAFVAEGKNQPAIREQLKNQIYLGTDAFIAKMQAKKPDKEDLSEIPLGQRRAMAKPLEHYASRSGTRDEAIINAYNSGAYGMKEVGDHFGLHYSRVSRIIASQRKAKES